MPVARVLASMSESNVHVWLHALCIGSNPCRLYESHVHVGFDTSPSGVRREYDASATGWAKGGLIELSLGILLSKGGMTKLVARVSRNLWAAAQGGPHGDSEE